MKSNHPDRSSSWWPLLLLAVALLLGILACDWQSFWIDEVSSATIARQPTLAAWWQAMLNDHGSSTQMPLFMLYVWAWEKVFGHAEFWLRLSNLPWLMLGLLAIPRRRVVFLGVLAISPFIWYYLDELRPYMMQTGSGLMLLGSLWQILEALDESGGQGRTALWVAFFCIGLLVLSGSSLLGMIWAGAILAAALFAIGVRRSLRLARRNAWLVALTALLLSALALYYLWTLKSGNRATPGSTGIASTLFIFYELFGFAGLGPGRTQLHSQGLACLPPYLPVLIFQTLITATVLYAGCKWIIRTAPRTVWLGAMAALSATTAFLLGVGVIKNFRVLGRHFAPAAPVLLLCVACGLQELWKRGRGWARLCVVLFVFLSLSSAVSLRLAWRHARDDYRDAAAIATAADHDGKKVWWCADELSGIYYGAPLLPLNAAPEPGRIWPSVNRTKSELAGQPQPDLIIVSKPELYDLRDSLSTYLTAHRYRLSRSLPAFGIWTRSESSENMISSGGR